MDEQRVEVVPGEHVLSFTIDAPKNKGFLLTTVSLRPNIPTARRQMANSSADGSWRATVDDPGAGGDDKWRLPGFDDSAFVALAERPVPEPKGNSEWSWEWLQRTAKGLGLPESPVTNGNAGRQKIGGVSLPMFVMKQSPLLGPEVYDERARWDLCPLRD